MVEQLTVFIIAGVVFYVVSIIGILVYTNWHKIIFNFRHRNHRDKLIRCLFVMPNTTIREEYLVHNIDNMVEYDGGLYMVNREFGLFTEIFKILTMVYVYKNPNPLNLKDLGKDNMPEFDTESLKLALKNKFIKDLMTEAKNQMILMILICVNIAITGILTLKIFGVFDKKGGG